MMHLCMNFYTPNRIRVVIGNQKSTRKCYHEAAKKINKKDAQIHTISQQVDKGDTKQRPTPVSDVEEIVIDKERPKRTIKIGVNLPNQLRYEVVHVLTSFNIIFAWGQEDMPKVDQ